MHAHDKMKKDVLNLKDGREGTLEDLRGRKGKGKNVVITLQSQK